MDCAFCEQVGKLLKKCMQGCKCLLLAHFDAFEMPMPPCSPKDNDINEHAEALQPGTTITALRHGGAVHDVPPAADQVALLHAPSPLPAHAWRLSRTAPHFYASTTVIDGLENYPVFLPPQLMTQAEFVEMLECLTGGWHVSIGVWLCVSIHGPFLSFFYGSQGQPLRIR